MDDDFSLAVALKIPEPKPDIEPDPALTDEPDEWHDWRNVAACANADPELFFDERNPRPALKYCERCPVVFDCLSFAESTDSAGMRHGAFGIFGGLTSGQRHSMRHQKAMQ